MRGISLTEGKRVRKEDEKHYTALCRCPSQIYIIKVTAFSIGGHTVLKLVTILFYTLGLQCSQIFLCRAGVAEHVRGPVGGQCSGGFQAS